MQDETIEFVFDFENDIEDITAGMETEEEEIEHTISLDVFTDKYVENILPGNNIEVNKDGKIYTISTINTASASQVNNLQQQVDNLQNSEDTEMNDIVSLIVRRADNFIEME